MKRSEFLFNAILVPVDFLAVFLAGVVAYYIRVSEWMRSIKPIVDTFDLARLVPFLIVFSGLSVIWFALAGLYKMHVTRTVFRELYLIFVSISTTVLVFVLYFFFDREFFSRFIILVLWLLGILFVFFGRFLIRSLQRFLSQQFGVGVHRVAIIGDQTEPGQALVEQLTQTKGHGYQLKYTATEFEYSDLKPLAQNDDIDEVMVCDAHASTEYLNTVNRFCEEHQLTFQYTPTLFEAYPKIEVHNLAGVLFFRVKNTNLEGWGSLGKRVFDVIFSFLFLLVFSPVYLIIALLIKLDSSGPVIYKNERVGLNGETFLLWKFRTMKQEYCTSEDNPSALEYERKLIEERSVKEGPIYKIKNDPRVTRIGNFLRKTSLDELPQFVNVLSGTMSVVGPRPHQPREVEGYEPHHKKIFSVKPGITGLAQISGRSDLSFEEEVLYDTFYIEHWSLWGDIVIILKTPFAMVMSRKVD